MRILVVTNYYPNHRGGVELVAEQLAERLSSLHDARITWIATNPDDYDLQSGKYYKIEPVAASDFLSKILPFDLPFVCFTGRNHIKNAVKNCDIVHIHDYLSHIGKLAYSYAKKFSKPILFTQHVGQIPFKKKYYYQLHSFLNKNIGRKALRGASGRVFVSEKVMDYFERECGVTKASELIPNGVDHNIFNPVSRERINKIRAELGYKPDDIIYMFAGKFEEKKGIDVLRYLANNLPDVKWIMAGAGEKNPNSWGYHNVKVYSDRAGKSLAELYRIADLFVLPSYGEGFPLVVQESMACGTPVMISNDTLKGFKKLEKHCFNLAILDEKPEEKWLDKCRILSKKVEKLHELRDDTAKFAQKEWSWLKTTKKYHDLMLDIIRYY